MSDNASNIGSYPSRIFRFYAEGFKGMTIGKKLWAIILIKLAIIFLVLRLFFFPDVLSEKYGSEEERSDAVRNVMINRQM